VPRTPQEIVDEWFIEHPQPPLAEVAGWITAESMQERAALIGRIAGSMTLGEVDGVLRDAIDRVIEQHEEEPEEEMAEVEEDEIDEQEEEEIDEEVEEAEAGELE
jgi:predicted ATPase with chaperone activity